MKKHNWVSQELERKHRNYIWLMWLFGLVALVCLFLMPEALKAWNLLPLGLAVVMWLLAWRVYSKDIGLKKSQQKPRNRA